MVESLVELTYRKIKNAEKRNEQANDTRLALKPLTNKRVHVLANVSVEKFTSSFVKLLLTNVVINDSINVSHVHTKILRYQDADCHVMRYASNKHFKVSFTAIVEPYKRNGGYLGTNKITSYGLTNLKDVALARHVKLNQKLSKFKRWADVLADNRPNYVIPSINELIENSDYEKNNLRYDISVYKPEVKALYQYENDSQFVFYKAIKSIYNDRKVAISDGVKFALKKEYNMPIYLERLLNKFYPLNDDTFNYKSKNAGIHLDQDIPMRSCYHIGLKNMYASRWKSQHPDLRDMSNYTRDFSKPKQRQLSAYEINYHLSDENIQTMEKLHQRASAYMHEHFDSSNDVVIELPYISQAPIAWYNKETKTLTLVDVIFQENPKPISLVGIADIYKQLSDKLTDTDIDKIVFYNCIYGKESQLNLTF